MNHFIFPRFSTRKSLLTKLLFVVIIIGISSFAYARGTNNEEYSTEQLQEVVNEAYAKFKNLKEGKNADYIPALAEIDPELFGIAIVTKNNDVYTAGDSDYQFAIESVAKPFTLALVMEQYHGPSAVLEQIGVEPTGLPFNSKLAIEILKKRSVNPLVNAGAIAAVSMLKADSIDTRWKMVLDYYSAFAGEKLELMENVYQSEYESSWSNRAISNLLYNYGRLYSDPEEALIVYTKECSVGVSTKQLAMMGATLANNGINPKTKKSLINANHIPELLAMMTMAGFYDESGLWAITSGLPSKTGVGGGIVSVVPGKMGIAAFSPPVNEAGNSVRAQKAIEYISRKLGLGVFGPNP